MWIERAIDLDFTIHDIKVKPHNMHIGPQQMKILHFIM